MKQGILILLLIIQLAIQPLSRGQLKTVGGELNRYLFNLKLDTDKNLLDGEMSLTYHNKANISLNKIYFHLYPNAFKPDGMTVVEWIKDDLGNELKWEVTGSDDTILQVNLAKEIDSGSSINLFMKFEVKIPLVADRFGYSNGIYCLGNALPIVSMYDEQGWNNDAYYPYGESFYSDFSNYEVNITVEKGSVVAATGKLKNMVNNSDGTTTTIWKAEYVREFVFVASSQYEICSETVDGIDVYSYYLPNHEKSGYEALKYAVQALKQYNTHFSSYPYKAFRVVETFGWFGGMEYPGLVMISSSLYDRGGDIFELVIAHETAHQWWYVSIANDEHDEPWLDEAFAEYTEVLYFEWQYGKEKADQIFDSYVGSRYRRYLRSGGMEYPLTSTVDDFGEDSNAYYSLIYGKGAMVLRALRYVVGDRVFFDILKRYSIERRLKITRISDFIRIANEVSGRNLTWFFQEWLSYAWSTTYSLKQAYYIKDGNYTVCFTITQTNPAIRMPVEVWVKTSSGNLALKVWVNGSTVNQTLTLKEKPIEIVVDPEDIVPGLDKNNEMKVALRGQENPQLKISQMDIILSMVALVIITSIIIALRWRRHKVKYRSRG